MRYEDGPCTRVYVSDDCRCCGEDAAIVASVTTAAFAIADHDRQSNAKSARCLLRIRKDARNGGDTETGLDAGGRADGSGLYIA